MNSLCKTICLMFAGISIFALHIQGEERVTIESLLHEMIDRDSIARYPVTDFRLKQHSSYNRESETPEPPKMKPTGWFANRDFNKGKNQTGRFIRTEEFKGRTEWVIMEDEGQGAIVRSWMPWRKQLSPETNTILRIYVDGASEPVIEGNQFELFQGKGLVPFLLAHESLRSAVSFFPIPYAKSCKVTVSELPFFYQFTYREYGDEVAVKSVTMDDFKAAAPLVEKVCRTLLEPKVKAAGKTVRFSKTLVPDAEDLITFPQGVAAVRELSVKLGSYADPEVMRKLVLKMSFDGKDTVWCPLGDFFGSGIGLNPFQGWFRTVAEDGTMSCRWVMPYQKSGSVSIVNLSDKSVSVELTATVGNWVWDDRSMYFHAQWRGQYPVPTRPFSDWNYVTTKGRGVYVGDTLTIMNPVSNWWGEGDEKIFVDGEKFPSIFGTGTEDYYAYSWGGRSTDFYEHPFHAQPKAHKYNKLNRKTDTSERNTMGYSVETRTRMLDAMPFGSSLQLDMEVWAGMNCKMGYGVGVYWYGDADTTSNRKPDPEGALLIPPLPDLTQAATDTEPPSATSESKAKGSTQQGKQPNIVLLISDDDDYEHFGFMGDKIARTPTLDALAKSGTLFTMAHCPAPLCRPSLASLLSGKLPHQHGIYANYLETKGVGTDKIKLDPTGSLANRLKNAGYATYATSKYWEGDPRTMGFTHGTVDTTFKGFQKFVRSDQNELNQFIDQHGPQKPMFIWWAPLLPHKPHNPPAKYLNQFADAEITIPPFYRGDRDKYAKALRKFYAMGTWFDDGVSDLIEKLKAAGEYENTVFLFYVDNGYAFGIPAKNSPTEKGLRTPMFVSWPGKPDRIPSQRVDDLSYALDLHATALDYAGIEPPSDIASRSLRPRIEGKQATAKETIFGAVYAHVPASYSGDPSIERSAERDVYALYARTKRWKYVLYTQDLNQQNDRYIRMVHEMSDAFQREQGDENLFDLDADPYEQEDQAALPGQKELVSKLRSQVQDWWTATGGKTLAVESKLLATKVRPAANPRSGQATRLPNIIFMLTDDLGYSDVGCYGAQKVKTPHIDRLAAEGVRFTDFHTAASICSPSRAAFLTGAYPQRAGLYMGINPRRTAHWFLGLHPDEITIAEQFQQQGYETHMVGKWHLGTDPEFLPRTQGFDHYYGMPCNYNHSPKFIDNGEEVFTKSPLNQLTQLYTDRVTSIIRDQAKRSEPFFLYYAHNYPHTPYEAGAAFRGTSQDGVRGDVMQELD